MPPPAAIGFRAHSGWAAAVAIVQAAAGPSEAPVVVARRRIEMRERGASGPSQPYHAAVGLDIREARRHVEACEAHAAARATNELRGMLEDLRQLGHPVAGCGLLLGSGRPLPPLEEILVSHPLLHTAEGERFAPALDPLQIEDVVDEANQPVRVGESDAQQVGCFVVHVSQNP